MAVSGVRAASTQQHSSAQDGLRGNENLRELRQADTDATETTPPIHKFHSPNMQLKAISVL